MRTFAAIVVIILISSLNIIQVTSQKYDQNIYDADFLKSPFEIKDQKTQKNYASVPNGGGGGCPACDSSVYPYCTQKLFHDACCCGLPRPECQYSDCSYIHANSCKEHHLITNCCCYNPYRSI